MYLPVPMFVLRRLVRQNPWLLSETGTVRRSFTVSLGILELEVQSHAARKPKQKAKLQAEAAAGTLFREGREEPR
jgi:hypothetical protein